VRGLQMCLGLICTRRQRGHVSCASLKAGILRGRLFPAPFDLCGPLFGLCERRSGRSSQGSGFRRGLEKNSCSKMAQDEYFRLGREGNWLDTSVSRDLASCCGVNLACAGFGVRGFFFWRGHNTSRASRRSAGDASCSRCGSRSGSSITSDRGQRWANADSAQERILVREDGF
jgi:hypothetical protein